MCARVCVCVFFLPSSKKPSARFMSHMASEYASPAQPASRTVAGRLKGRGMLRAIRFALDLEAVVAERGLGFRGLRYRIHSLSIWGVKERC